MPDTKITPITFVQIKQYAKSHTAAETSKHFGINDASIFSIKRYSNYQEWKDAKNEKARENYRKRKEKLTMRLNGTSTSEPVVKWLESPFGEGAKPEIVKPLGNIKLQE